MGQACSEPRLHTDKGDNKVLLSETDYDLYVTFYLHNVSNGTETRVLALFGTRTPPTSSHPTPSPRHKAHPSLTPHSALPLRGEGIPPSASPHGLGPALSPRDLPHASPQTAAGTSALCSCPQDGCQN